MANILRGSAHGFAYLQVGLVDQNGASWGTAGPGAANGTTTHMYLIKEPKSADMPLPDRTVIDFAGGDRWLGSYMYGITSLGSFTCSIDPVDTTLIAMVGGSLVDSTTNQEWTIYGENVLAAEIPQVCVILNFHLQSRAVGSDGGSYWLNYLINRAWMAPKGVSGAPAFQTGGEYQFQITPTASDRFPTNEPFGVNQDFQDNKTPVVAIISDNPLALTTHISDAAATTFVLGYRPVSTDTTSTNGRNHFVSVTTATNVTSVTTTSGVVTAAAGSAGAYRSMLYETIFQGI